MATCANCDEPFKEKADKRGFHRFSLENKFPGCERTGRETFAELTGTIFTPNSKRKGKFVCPPCWSKLHSAAKYKGAVSDLWGSTASTSYVASKRKATETSCSTPNSAKKPRFTSTPIKVRQINCHISRKTIRKKSKDIG